LKSLRFQGGDGSTAVIRFAKQARRLGSGDGFNPLMGKV